LDLKGTTMTVLRHLSLLAVGLVAIIAGYVLLAGGRLSLGPIFLVAGYCVILPAFVWQLFRRGVGE